ncbi:helix-turn-helix domain-containing protein [Melghiribacillus thermohalophilus]|nr:helix-turn-helix transcriptional regulator [Melghiribacillus thermohalophilus]
MEQKLAENIKYFRKLQNWTQQDLAKHLQISRSVVAKWESGTSVPDVKTLILLSKTFQVSIDHLVGMNTSRADLLKEFQKMYMSADQRQWDPDMMEIFDYLVKHPRMKEYFLEMIKLPLKKQKVVHRMFQTIIDEMERT